MQLSGFAIIRKPEFDIQDYMRSDFAQKHLHLLRPLRAAASFLEPSRYRGIGRAWLEPFPAFDELVKNAFAVQSNARARSRFLQLIDEFDITAEEEEGLLPNEMLAREVFSLLDDCSQYELIQLHRREFFPSSDFIGYDIGYWGSDHYSLIADCFVTPRWHGPPPDKFHLVAERLRGLNTHLLFPTPDDATGFRTWYRGEDWTETELKEDQFEIIQVCTVNPK